MKLALILSWTIAIVLALLPFHAILTTWAGSNFGYLDTWRIWKEIMLVASLPLAAVLVWRSHKIREWLMGSWIMRLFMVYTVLHLITGIWALTTDRVNDIALAYSHIVNLRFIGFFILCAIAAATCSLLINNWQKILLLPAAVVTVFGLAQKLVLPFDFLRHFGYSPDTIPAYQTVDAKLDYRRVQSTLRGANPLGAYLLLIITAVAVFLRKNRALWIVGLAATSVVLFFSYSRSAWIGLALSIGTLVLLEKPKLLNTRNTVVLVVSLLMIGAGIYSLRSNDVVQDTLFHTSEASASSESSNEQRLNAMRVGAEDILSEPLGSGPGTAGPASFRNNNQPRIAENYFLQIGQEVGIVGLAIFVAMNVLVGVELWKRRSSELAKILLASLVGITFVNLVSHAWTDDTLAYLWWGLAGIACAPDILSGRHKQDGEKKKQTA